MSRINKNKMWMGNPVLRKPALSFVIESQSEQIKTEFSGTPVVSLTEGGKTKTVNLQPDLIVTPDTGTTVFIYADQLTSIEDYSATMEYFTVYGDMGLNSILIQDAFLKTFSILGANPLDTINISSNSNLTECFIKSSILTSLNISGCGFLQDENLAKRFCDSLQISDGATLKMSSSDTYATYVQGIAEGKGWKVTIS